MYRIYGLMIGACVLVGSSFLAYADDSQANGNKLILKKLFNVVDLSSADPNINSVLDKQHVSRKELELLKAQALQEALEETAYNISAAEDAVPQIQAIRSGENNSKKPKKTFDQSLEELKLDDKLVNEFQTFATTVRGLMDNAVKAFQNFQKSPEVKELQKDAEETATKAGTELQKAVEGFMKSDEFKEFQGTATGILQRLNSQINKFLEDKEEKK